MESLGSWRTQRNTNPVFFFFFESEYFSYLCKLFYSVCDFLSLLHKSETLTRSQHEREAEEHKELWEAEVRARTKLGSKVK